MIYNLIKVKYHLPYKGKREPISNLAVAPHTFYLTGSRFIGKCGLDTDFFVEHNDAVVQFLRTLGFEVPMDEMFPYPVEDHRQDLVQMMEYKGDFPEDTVHVQIVRDANKKLLIQRAIEPLLEASYFTHTDKEIRKGVDKSLWVAAYSGWQAAVDEVSQQLLKMARGGQ